MQKTLLVFLMQNDKEKYIEQWRLVFWITFAVNIITLIVYLIWGSGEVQPWNNADDQEKAEGKEKGKTNDAFNIL